MHYGYVLFCKDHQLYIGYTTDLKNRLQAHKNGEVRSTKNRRPVTLFYCEYYCNTRDAKAREIYLKSGSGHKNFKRQHQHQLRKLGYKNL